MALIAGNPIQPKSSGLKGWLEENISKKGMEYGYNKAAEYQKKEMSKEVVSGVTQGDLYSGIVAGVTGLGLKASKYIPRMLRTVSRGGKKRNVVAIEMQEGGKKFVQPFYKSTGTSGVSKSDIAAGKLAKRKDVWEPFMGRTEGGKYYKDTRSPKAIGGSGPGWWIKGWKDAANKWSLAANNPKNLGDVAQRTGPYKKVSNEISRLEGLGYFQEAGSVVGKTRYGVNKWLKGYGHKRPRSIGNAK